jgi:hypothetical protein
MGDRPGTDEAIGAESGRFIDPVGTRRADDLLGKASALRSDRPKRRTVGLRASVCRRTDARRERGGEGRFYPVSKSG